MPVLLRFMDWPMRTKMVVLLVIASLLPLTIATWINIAEARQRLISEASAVLSARADQLVDHIDTFNTGFMATAERVRHLPDIVALLQGPTAGDVRFQPRLQSLLGLLPANDPRVRAIGVLGRTGVVRFATDPRLIGLDMGHRSFVQEALRGNSMISEVYLAEPVTGEAPSIAYVAPIHGDRQELLGVVAVWVNASALWEQIRAANGVAGEGSFAVLFDARGIRMAHSATDDLLYRPAAPLDPATVDALVAEQRFGTRTRQLLEDRSLLWAGLRLAGTGAADPGMFTTVAPFNRQPNYAVARGFATAPWTLYDLIPQTSLQALIAQLTVRMMGFALLIALLALVTGAVFASGIVQPIGQLSEAAHALAAGDMDRRVTVKRRDEFGELAGTFNMMAGRIQEQSAALLKESKDRYRQLFEALQEACCTIRVEFDDQGRCIDWYFLEVNAAFSRQTGLPYMLGRRITEVVQLEQVWYDFYGRVAMTGEPGHIEDESPALGRWFDVHAYRVGNPEDRTVAVLFNNITEQKKAQQRLQHQLERLSLLHQITRAIGERHDMASIYQVVIRALEDRLPIDFGCICVYLPTEQQLQVERVGLRSHELARELALAENMRVDIDANGLSRCVRGQLVHEPDVSESKFPFPQRLAGGGLRAMVAAPLLVESQVFGVLIAARRQPHSFSSGECEFLKQLSEHVALAAHQAKLYTALQAAYDDLRHTQQSAMQQERLRALGQMSSGIAHDINNAISPAALYADSLLEREGGLSEQGRRQLQTIQRAVHDVAATVARMREFYRQREPQLLLAAVQLNELVQQVIDLTRARWSDMPQQRGITIETVTQLQPDLPLVRGMESELREALTNLVFNAVDAMPQGGTLTLRTRAAPRGRVAVEVVDTGIGMDEDARRRCLEPFFTTKGERGTGLGLAMVYGVLQRHGADIEIESAVGRGTTVRLGFAAAAAPDVVTAQPVISVPAGLRLLIVDDDPVLLRSLRETLEADGHVVSVANGGQEGIDQFRAALREQDHFSAVITDLGMPYVDGRQVAAAIKGLSAATPVIMLTGWGQRLVADGEIPPHVNLVLGKPPKLRDLREALAATCGAPRAPIPPAEPPAA